MLRTESPLEQPIGLRQKTFVTTTIGTLKKTSNQFLKHLKSIFRQQAKPGAMGCVSTKAERDAVAGFAASNVNRFQVMNVDDEGHRLCPGHLEVGESDLILYQVGKNPVRWPLRSLRRYGFDADLFSFECGRRCPTGPGIYAFHCGRAETLFNHVQARVAARQDEQELGNGVLLGNNHPRSRVRHNMPTSRRVASLLLPGGNALLGDQQLLAAEEEGSYLEPIRLQQHGPMWSPNSRPLSSASLISSSSSPISPSNVGAAASNLYANNEALLAAAADASVSGLLSFDPGMAVTMEAVLLPPPTAYANLHESSTHSVAKDHPDDFSADDNDDCQQHLYINVGPDALENKIRPLESTHGGASSLAGIPLKQVNYVLLDLDKGSDSTTTTTTTGHQLNSPEGSVASFPDSPSHRHCVLPTELALPAAHHQATPVNTEGYATIDFDRTAALSSMATVGVLAFSALAGCEEEEQGLRKTRHNATMMNTPASNHAARLLGLNRQTSSVSSE